MLTVIFVAPCFFVHLHLQTVSSHLKITLILLGIDTLSIYHNYLKIVLNIQPVLNSPADNEGEKGRLGENKTVVDTVRYELERL